MDLLVQLKDTNVEIPCIPLDKPLQPTPTENWCSIFNNSIEVWLHIFLVVIAITAILTVGIFVHIVVKETTKDSTALDQTKQRLRRVIITSFLLLSTFFLCWLPLVAYEIAMVLVAELIQASMPPPEVLMFVHRIFFALYLCSPLLLPVIYAARNRSLRLHLLSCCCSRGSRQHTIMRGARLTLPEIAIPRTTIPVRSKSVAFPTSV